VAMKKAAAMLFLLAYLILGGMAQEKIDRTLEDGVEVIDNHLKPYKIKGEPTALVLDKLFSIDTEQNEIAEVGLVDIETFDVDSDGNIYLIRWRSDQNYIYKFDKTGRFLMSFLRLGQGPGEIEWGGTVLVKDNGEIMAKDPSKRKFLLYDRDGKFIREVQLPGNIGFDALLGNEKYLVSWQKQEPQDKLPPDYYHNYFGICGPDFKVIKELGGIRWPNPDVSPQIKTLTYVFVTAATKDSIFIGDAQKGYEICVYNLDGELIRKIRKEYKPLKVPNEIKKNYEKPASHPVIEEYRKKTVFPDRMPPFRYLFADDEGRLYVMTWEKSQNRKKYMYDIFNPQGVFICRTSLGNYYVQGSFKREYESLVIAREDRLYCLVEKESGFKELVVYRMTWK
jgi:outer membrane protein assembly factor BamB